MEAIKSLKELFKGSNNIFGQIAIFSLSGIIALCFNKCLSAMLGNFYGSYLGYAQDNSIVLSLCYLCAIILSIFLFTYGFVYSNKLLNTEECELPNMSLSSSKVFIKLLPLIITWGIYYLFAIMLGLSVFSVTGFLFYLYYALIFLFLPFTGVTFVEFSKNYEYKPEIFGFYSTLKNIDKYFIQILKIILQCGVIFIIGYAIVVMLFWQSNKFVNPSVQLGLRLIGLTLGVYVLNLVNLFYINRTTKIIK